MSNTKPRLLTNMQYAVLWIGTGLLMLASTVGHLFDLWPLTSVVWWVALAGLICLSGAQTYEYIYERRAA